MLELKENETFAKSLRKNDCFKIGGMTYLVTETYSSEDLRKVMVFMTLDPRHYLSEGAKPLNVELILPYDTIVTLEERNDAQES